ncbi:JmjC domain protein [Tricharina praecox]|uniref:JmjC domain protein n=1 Tax=Tricharina praecox TaxID=43433 RepID=UPI00221E3856|nr:JmjC domain protein [Tricharina praecox]KAI5851969.1 JmjC domain protein [Tricharina praecox]
MQSLPILRDALRAHFASHTPCQFPRGAFAALIPANKTWFSATGALNLDFFQRTLSERDLATRITVESSTSTTFERVSVPFELLLHYLSLPELPPGLPELYLAQTPLLELIPALKESIPTPAIVEETGRGDVYATNLWLGRCESINTPLHKDPNPNLFVQIAGRKRVRMFSPAVGKKLIGSDVARFRTEEDMMLGEARKRLEEVVWGAHDGQDEAYEVEVGPGDGCFIPTGWWHAVKGVGSGVGASVNWWFR